MLIGKAPRYKLGGHELARKEGFMENLKWIWFFPLSLIVLSVVAAADLSEKKESLNFFKYLLHLEMTEQYATNISNWMR